MATTECKLCNTTEDRELAEHLEEHHADVVLSLEYDPETNHGIVHGLSEISL